jgi:hypothetical protein
VEALSDEATVADVCDQLRSMFGEADNTGHSIMPSTATLTVCCAWRPQPDGAMPAASQPGWLNPVILNVLMGCRGGIPGARGDARHAVGV